MNFKAELQIFVCVYMFMYVYIYILAKKGTALAMILGGGKVLRASGMVIHLSFL